MERTAAYTGRVQNENRAEIVIVGGGPRGVSLLERIGATLREDGVRMPMVIHVVDDVQIGAGRIWRTDQTRELCMNTLADAVTLFTDASVTMAGTVVPGPTLYEWALMALHAAGDDSRAADADRVAVAHRRAFAESEVRPGFAADYSAEVRSLRPESHPSRALYGEYISWCFARAVGARPEGVTVRTHQARAVGITAAGDHQNVVLDDGETLHADAVVLATGWLPRARTAQEEALGAAAAAHPELVWIHPDSPVDQDLHRVPDGAHAIVRGLGMGFFDAMALLTVGRGGRFESDPSRPGGLRYAPSGREPVLHVTSHRGVPYRAKSMYGGLPPRAPQRHLRSVDWASVRRPIDFDEAIWPLVVKDAFADYYETLHRVRPDAFAAQLGDVLHAIDAAVGEPAALDAAVAPLVPGVDDRFDFDAAVDPAGGLFTSPEAFDAWVIRFVEDDLADALAGVDSPVKAALWSLSSARQPASRIGAFGGFDAESRSAGFRRLHAIGSMVGSGPPAFRNRQLLALAEAGLVHFIGPAAGVAVADGAFRAASPAVAGSEVSAPVLIDAWMHFHDVSTTADPLIASLAGAGRLRPFRVRSRAGEPVATGGIDVDAATGLLIGADGTLDPAVHLAGIPVEETMHDSIISPMPRADATMLRETDRVARSMVRIALHAQEIAGVRGGGGADE